ncbi:glycosyltransferase [Lagierella sp.]|uniref:glycosyltransferase n=1 Tax=Lagierella sp. TaxID=2849657 RepID=UPI0026115AD4|nr:glycosyltransferase [Lagierella sp.]
MASQGIPNSKSPMYGIHQLEYAKALMEFGIEVYIVALDLRSIRRWRKWGYHRGEIQGIRYYNISLPLGNFNELLQMKYGSKVLGKYLNDILEEERGTDLIHSHFLNHSYPFVHAAKNNGLDIPIVISEHSSHVNKENIQDITKEKRIIGNYVYNNCDKLIVGSPYFKSVLEKNFGVEAVVSPTVADTKSFTLDNKDFQEGTFRVVSTGNLIVDKGHFELISAFSKVFKGVDATLKIFGQGVEYNNLKRLIESKGMTNQIYLLGHHSLDEINKEYNNSDLFVLASHHETYGKVYIEAMSSGLPVITVDNGGSEHFIKDFNGVIAQKKNVEDLANKLKLMYNKIRTNELDKSRIRENVLLNFSKEASIRDLKRIYSEVLEGDNYVEKRKEEL